MTADDKLQKLTWNLDSAGFKTRALFTKDGNIKYLTRMSFVVWNHKLKKHQYAEFARKWTIKALKTMSDLSTTTLIVTHKGNGFDTNYEFTTPV